MKQPSSIQILIACAAVALLALWSSINFYSTTNALTEPSADVYKVGDQAARFQDLMAALPVSGVFGYVSDVPGTETLGAALYGSAQYTLAPRMLTDQPKPSVEWVIGDFARPLDVVEFGKQRGLNLVKDFGNGAVLYRKQAR